MRTDRVVASAVLGLITLSISLPNLRAQTNGVICFEAEDYSSLEAPFKSTKADQKEVKSVSGGAFLEIPWSQDYKDSKQKGLATYKIKFAQAGTYYVWVRAYWIHACGNSVSVTFDDQKPVEITDSTDDHWHWVTVPAAKFKLTAGEHTFKLLGTEAGIKVDQIFLTTDPDYIPQKIRKVNYKVNEKK